MSKHESLAEALAAFQAELPRLRKDETAKVKGETQDGRPVNYSYGYADLAQVSEAVCVCLGQHGLAFTAWPTMTEHGFVLQYTLMHDSGDDARHGVWPLPDPMRTKPQQLGSAITYARRYAIMAVTGTFPDKEDDDGAAAVPAGHRDQAMSPNDFDNLPKERPARTPQAERPVSTPPAPTAQKTSWTDDEVREQIAKLTQLDLEKAGKLYDWMAAKDLHNRPVPHLDSAKDGVTVTNTATGVLAVRLADEAMTPESTMADIKALQAIATGRGLMKVPVSETETLAEALYGAQELAKHAETEQGPGGA